MRWWEKSSRREKKAMSITSIERRSQDSEHRIQNKKLIAGDTNCILGKPPPPAVRPEKAPPFRRESRLLLKAVHDYEHVHVNVYVGHPKAVDETRGR